MKRFFIWINLLLLTCLFAKGSAEAQNIVLGERLPEMRIGAWLMDMQPEDCDYTLILFHHSESRQCRRALQRAEEIIKKYPQFNIVILTKEPYSKAGVELTGHLADRIGVAFDNGGRTFAFYGVKFIPFCVICDKRERAIWCGNTLTLNNKIIEQIITKKSK